MRLFEAVMRTSNQRRCLDTLPSNEYLWFSQRTSQPVETYTFSLSRNMEGFLVQEIAVTDSISLSMCRHTFYCIGYLCWEKDRSNDGISYCPLLLGSKPQRPGLLHKLTLIIIDETPRMERKLFVLVYSILKDLRCSGSFEKCCQLWEPTVLLSRENLQQLSM